MLFQSALPLRGATTRLTSYTILHHLFQSALPLRGATAHRPPHRQPWRQFQSALPLRGATILSIHHLKHHEISIRAPLAGSDQGMPVAIACWMMISIRAPLAGSDRICAIDLRAFWIFQSALPLRGATNAASDLAYTQAIFQSALPLRGATGIAGRYRFAISDFNPRSPCGERPKAGVIMPPSTYFNPRSPCGERPLHFVASLYYQQNIVVSKTVAANSSGKSRKTAAKFATT